MALHMIRSTPNFTRSMRGYDVEEVDEYVDALRESEDEQAETLAATEAANGLLNAEIERLRGRIAELEGCIRAETPRSIAALGERLTLVLEEAEAGASDAVRVAQEEAEVLLASAYATAEQERLFSTARSADAEQRASARIGGAEEAARSTEAGARARAEEIVGDAESQALARRREIEAWVERVRAHIEGEEGRAVEEFARVQALRNAELLALGRRRDAMFTSLQEMADSLRNLMATAKATTDSANESTLQLGHVGAAPEAPEAPPEAGGDGDSTGSLVLTTSSPPESAAFSDSSTPPPVASEVCPSPPSEEDPSAFEEAKMAAFFGPDVQPVASFGGDDEAQTPPAPQGNPFPAVRTAARPPFDIDAGGTPFDAVAFTSAANFYGDSRVR